MSEWLVLAAIALVSLSGFPGAFFPRRSSFGQWLSVLLMVTGGGLGLGGALLSLAPGKSEPLRLSWSVPGARFGSTAEFSVALDALSVMFLLPVFLVPLLGSVYGLEYWRQADHPNDGRKLRLFYGLITGGMALLVIARNALVFLIGWEIMALSAFFLVATEDTDSEVREAAWLYLGATHVASLCLFGLFGLLRLASGSFALGPLSVAVAPGMATAIFLLALGGFGLKAGIMPLHIWLPNSHAAAPSHVSAIMSGVLIKMGIYGLFRIVSFFPQPPLWWGGLVLALGVISGVLGVAFAIGQHDVKRLLAYHSIENIGIIIMGLGLALLGRSMGRADFVVLGLAGSLLHVWNHCLFKALLFLSAGSVVHATHTREIDHLGGLAKKMPRTAFFFLVGAVAICGLPPLNGFISEFLLYLGLFGSMVQAEGRPFLGVAMSAPALALIGTLAAACFVKVFSAVFLGAVRSEHAEHAHESGPAMIGPMAVLGGCCLFIGVLPQVVAPLLERAAMDWAPTMVSEGSLAGLAPLGTVSVLALVLLGALALGGLLLWGLLRRNGTAQADTWGCGYAAPTPRIQYTSSSFAETLVGLFGWALQPKKKMPALKGPFPEKSEFKSDVPDTVLDRLVMPVMRAGAAVSRWFRWFQHGGAHMYLLYILIILVIFLLWR
jgi:hydrogenase-4 component B